MLASKWLTQPRAALKTDLIKGTEALLTTNSLGKQTQELRECWWQKQSWTFGATSLPPPPTLLFLIYLIFWVPALAWNGPSATSCWASSVCPFVLPVLLLWFGWEACPLCTLCLFPVIPMHSPFLQLGIQMLCLFHWITYILRFMTLNCVNQTLSHHEFLEHIFKPSSCSPGEAVSVLHHKIGRFFCKDSPLQRTCCVH